MPNGSCSWRLLKLKFKHQPFQEDAARAVCSVFEGDGVNLSVEMETGVGKTYTYIKTIHELYKKYGWMKYMIVVPSIAIRKGVHKCFKELEEHFMMDSSMKTAIWLTPSWAWVYTVRVKKNEQRIKVRFF